MDYWNLEDGTSGASFFWGGSDNKNIAWLAKKGTYRNPFSIFVGEEFIFAETDLTVLPLLMWTTVRRRSRPHNKSLLRLRDPSRTLTGACDDMAHLPARSHGKSMRHVLFVNHQITINNMHTAYKFTQLTDVSRVHNDLLLSLLSIVYSTYITCICVNPLWESYLLVNNGIPWHSQFMDIWSSLIIPYHPQFILDLWWSPKLIINEPFSTIYEFIIYQLIIYHYRVYLSII